MATYPSEEECYRLLSEYHVPENIVRHSQQVTKIAVFLAEKLKKKGIEIDVGLVRAAGILHDIARPLNFKDFSKAYIPPTEEDLKIWRELKNKYSGMGHTDAGYEIFKGKYPELALIIRRHNFMAVINDKPDTWEEKIINYSDKRVAHENIVTISERIIEGNKRWFKEHPDKKEDKEETRKIKEINLDFEKEIFSIIGIDPDRLEEEMDKEETE